MRFKTQLELGDLLLIKSIANVICDEEASLEFYLTYYIL